MSWLWFFGGVFFVVAVGTLTYRLGRKEGELKALLQRTERGLGAIQDQLTRMEKTMSQELDSLTVQVTRNTDVEASAVVLLKGLAQQIADLKTDPVKLQALSDNLKTSADALAEAVVANTPAA